MDAGTTFIISVYIVNFLCLIFLSFLSIKEGNNLNYGLEFLILLFLLALSIISAPMVLMATLHSIFTLLSEKISLKLNKRFLF